MPTMAEALKDANPCAGGEGCQCDHGKYYVTAVNGSAFYVMAGPYSTHREAEADRNKALQIADDIDGRAWFMGWGVTRMADDYTKVGKLNELGLL